MILTIVSCEEQAKNKEEDRSEPLEKGVNTKIVNKVDMKYLYEMELEEYVKNAKNIELQSDYPTPFDTLKFNKVIAYDFEGKEEHYPSIFNNKNGKFVPVILRQQELKSEQVSFLLDFLTDNSTYGEMTAACFEPHLGFVFYKNNTRIYNIDICLDCNYLISTTEIPASVYRKKIFDTGDSYELKGFSDYGRSKIIEISKELGLDYGKIKIDK